MIVLVVVVSFLPAICQASLHPIVFVPGYFGSKLEGSFDRNLLSWPPYCLPKSSTYLLWLDINNFYPFIRDCWLKNIKLSYSPAIRRTFSRNVVVVNPKNFGSTNGVDFVALPPESISPNTIYYNTMINAFVRMGYTKNYNLRGAPYDWRKAYHENDYFQKNFKILIEETYRENGLPVVIVAHSMGCTFTYAFLNERSENWKSKYIAGWASIGGPFGGEFKRMYGFFADDDFPANIFPIIRQAERTFSTMAAELPEPSLYKNEVLVQTSTKNYTANDYQEFFNDLGMSDAYESWLDSQSTYDVANMSSPGAFPVLCLIGTSQRTLSKAIVHGTLTPSDIGRRWTAFYGDGDKFVNYESARKCLSFGKRKSNFVYKELPVDHLSLVRENQGIEIVTQFVDSINNGATF